MAPSGEQVMKILRPEEVTPEIMARLEFRELTPEELKEVYAQVKAAFTAEDLQKYTEIEEGVLVDHVIAQMEKRQQEADQRNG
jgi:hypothetical protein